MRIKEASPITLVDAFTIGFNGRVKGFYNDEGASLSTAMARVTHEGSITTPKSKRSSKYERVTFSLEIENGNPAGTLDVDIHTSRENSDLILSNRCAIRGNGMRLLRGELGPETCGRLGFSKADNFLSAQHAGTRLVPTQLELLAQLLQYAIAVLETAFPTLEPGKLWLKRAEACRDLPVANATAAAHILQHSTLTGSNRRKWDLYSRVGGREADCGPTIRFLTTTTYPVVKVYPKREDILRLEVACGNRKSFYSFMNAVQLCLAADRAHQLFSAFISAATPVLDQMEEHVKSTLSSEASIASLLAALDPLIGRMSGLRKTRGPASPQAQEMATRAIEALLSGGMYNATGTVANHAIRRDLDSLCGSDGPLVKHQRSAIYYLKPRFARACASMRLAIAD